MEETRSTPRDRWVSKWHDALKVSRSLCAGFVGAPALTRRPAPEQVVAKRFPDQHQQDVAFTVLLRLYAHRVRAGSRVVLCLCFSPRLRPRLRSLRANWRSRR